MYSREEVKRWMGEWRGGYYFCILLLRREIYCCKNNIPLHTKKQLKIASEKIQTLISSILKVPPRVIEKSIFLRSYYYTTGRVFTLTLQQCLTTECINLWPHAHAAILPYTCIVISIRILFWQDSGAGSNYWSGRCQYNVTG